MFTNIKNFFRNLFNTVVDAVKTVVNNVVETVEVIAVKDFPNNEQALEKFAEITEIASPVYFGSVFFFIFVAPSPFAFVPLLAVTTAHTFASLRSTSLTMKGK